MKLQQREKPALGPPIYCNIKVHALLLCSMIHTAVNEYYPCILSLINVQKKSWYTCVSSCNKPQDLGLEPLWLQVFMKRNSLLMLLFLSCLCPSVCVLGKLGYGLMQDSCFLMLLRKNAAEVREIKRKKAANQNCHRGEVKPSACVINFKLHDTITLTGIEFQGWGVGWKPSRLTNKGSRDYSLGFLMDLITCKWSYQLLLLFQNSTKWSNEKLRPDTSPVAI